MALSHPSPCDVLRTQRQPTEGSVENTEQYRGKGDKQEEPISDNVQTGSLHEATDGAESNQYRILVERAGSYYPACPRVEGIVLEQDDRVAEAHAPHHFNDKCSPFVRRNIVKDATGESGVESNVFVGDSMAVIVDVANVGVSLCGFLQ